MSLILPIMMMAVFLGLVTKKTTPAVWVGMTVWIIAVTVHYYLKN